MNLHRVDAKPDWRAVPPRQRNGWQRVAAATGGVVSIGNFFSVLGLASVPIGLWLLLGRHEDLPALAVLALGRICDLLDGWLADKTGTKSPIGEKLDATFDKISVFATLLSLLITGWIPVWIFIALVLPHIAVAAIGLLAYIRGKRLHVSPLGKISGGLGWAFLFLWIASAATGMGLSDSLRWVLIVAGMLALGLSVITGLASFEGYVRSYAKSSTNR